MKEKLKIKNNVKKYNRENKDFLFNFEKEFLTITDVRNKLQVSGSLKDWMDSAIYWNSFERRVIDIENLLESNDFVKPVKEKDIVCWRILHKKTGLFMSKTCRSLIFPDSKNKDWKIKGGIWTCKSYAVRKLNNVFFVTCRSKKQFSTENELKEYRDFYYKELTLLGIDFEGNQFKIECSELECKF